MTAIPPPLAGVEHSILVEIGWSTIVRVPIDGLTCPGCGIPLHQTQDERGVLSDHTVRDTVRADTGALVRPMGARNACTSKAHPSLYCEWDADRLTVHAFRLAKAMEATT